MRSDQAKGASQVAPVEAMILCQLDFWFHPELCLSRNPLDMNVHAGLFP